MGRLGRGGQLGAAATIAEEPGVVVHRGVVVLTLVVVLVVVEIVVVEFVIIRLVVQRVVGRTAAPRVPLGLARRAVGRPSRGAAAVAIAVVVAQRDVRLRRPRAAEHGGRARSRELIERAPPHGVGARGRARARAVRAAGLIRERDDAGRRVWTGAAQRARSAAPPG